MELLQLVAIIVPIPAAWGITLYYDMQRLPAFLCCAGAAMLVGLFLKIFSRKTQVTETN